MAVYLDLIMVLNFLVDFSLLLGTNRLSGFSPGYGRCFLGAVFGGLYSGACLLPGFSFLGNTFWRLVSLMIMSAIAFGFQLCALRRAGVFFLLSMALGGIALSFGKRDVLRLLSSCGILWAVCMLGFPETPGKIHYEQVTLGYKGKTVSVLALQDTGNTLTDPITGEQVLVISAEVAGQLTGLTREQLQKPLEAVGAKLLPGLRLIPYQTIGGAGMLLAMRFQDVTIGNRRVNPIVAFATEGFGKGTVYQALTGGAL